MAVDHHDALQMTLDLNWAALDEELAAQMAGALDRALHAADLPSYVGEISVSSFAFGDVDPDVQLLDIRDVDAGFHPVALDVDGDGDADGSEEDEDEDPADGAAPSLQMHLRLAYSGNLRIGLRTSLLINVPAPAFMALPLALTVTGLAFHGTVVVAYDGPRRQAHISVLDPALDPGAHDSDDDTLSWRSFERARPADRLLTELVVESEVGQADKHVLRNVGKVEKFILELARAALEAELVWPAYQTVLF